MDKLYDTIIIGGGPAGYTAALYAARAGLDTLILERVSVGGQMSLTGDIENYPGFPDGIDGFTLGMNMRQAAERFGAITEYDEASALSLDGEIKTVETPLRTYRARTVIIATGAGPRPLGIEGEEELVGAGVHYCAHCDGRFYKGKTVAVVGGGNSALEDALYLANLAERVYLIHRRGEFRASRIYTERVMKDAKIEQVLFSTVEQLKSDEGRLSAISVRDVRSGELRDIELDGLFVSIGRNPETSLLSDILELDAAGYILAGESTETSLPGVFAAGDVRTKELRQVVTAAADGAVAAYRAEEYIHLGSK